MKGRPRHMINEELRALGAAPNKIRETFAYGLERKAQIGEDRVFDLSIGNPSVPSPECVDATIARLVTEGKGNEHGYTPSPGLIEVRNVIADNLNRRYGTDYTGENLYLTSGASSAIAITFKALVCPGEQVITVSPYFMEYKTWTHDAGGELIEVPARADDFQIDVPAMEAAINEKTAVVIINSPNNPVGSIYSDDNLKELATVLERKSAEYGHPIYLLSDEPYRELAYDGEEVPFIPAIYKDTIYCYSFSKTLSLPGERIGFLAIHPELTDYARVRAAIYGAGRALGYINASTMFQLVAAECVGQTADISVYKQNRDLIHTALLDMGYTCVKPSGAFYLFLKTPEPDATAFCKKAMALDLLVVPGDEFGCPGYVRLAYCVPKTMLERSLPRFRQLADQYGLKK